MTTLDWKNLRTIDGSQHKAFEQLCCQMAQDIKPSGGKEFIKKGSGGDAGVECYWLLENGDEIGWQAKFFLSPPDYSQWAQIDDSVKTAIEKHPRLIRYTICLPIDRSDARIEGRTSSLDHWNERVKKWSSWAKNQNMAVTFRYCGQQEIFTWLSDGPRGRWFYWFRREYFDDTWFEKQFKYARDLAGARYTPEVHIELPVVSLFHSLGRTTGFVGHIQEKHRNIESFDTVVSNLRSHLGQLEGLGESIERHWQLLTAMLIEIYDVPLNESINLVALANHIQGILKQLRTATNHLESQNKEDKEALYNNVHALQSRLEQFRADLESESFLLANRPFLALIGGAGAGKTHLLCDMAQARLREGYPTILLMGEQFLESVSWQAVLNALDLTCPIDEFLGALNSLAQVRQKRALIMIDALNESPQYLHWEPQLVQFISKIEDYSHIGLVVSIRSPYEQRLIRQDLIDKKKLIKAYHEGFTGYEFKATRTFFKHYQIPEPRVPLLNPEFSNPLFLNGSLLTRVKPTSRN